MTTNPASAEVDAHLRTHRDAMRTGPKLMPKYENPKIENLEVAEQGREAVQASATGEGTENEVRPAIACPLCGGPVPCSVCCEVPGRSVARHQKSCASCGKMSSVEATACICGCTTFYPCLAVGEVIQEGDEWENEFTGTWIPVSNCFTHVVPKFENRYRRPTHSSAPDATETPRTKHLTPREWERELGYIILDWDGFRDINEDAQITQADFETRVVRTTQKLSAPAHRIRQLETELAAAKVIVAGVGDLQRTNADLRAENQKLHEIVDALGDRELPSLRSSLAKATAERDTWIASAMNADLAAGVRIADLEARLKGATDAADRLRAAYEAQHLDEDLRNPDAGDAFWKEFHAFTRTQEPEAPKEARP